MLRAGGATIETTAEPGTLHISGLDCAAVGDRAAAHGLTIHELAPHNASLEAAYMELTRDSVDYAAGSGKRAETATDQDARTVQTTTGA